MIEEYPCHYCSHPCNGGNFNVKWNCQQCKATFYWYAEHTDTELEYTIKNEEYLIILDRKYNRTTLTTLFDLNIIAVFNGILNITPSNIEDKLKIILTFL